MLKIKSHTNTSTCIHKSPLNIIYLILLSTLLLDTQQINPNFLTNLPDCKAGNIVLTISSATTTSGYDYTTTSLSFATVFSSKPNVGLGLDFLSSTYTTTTSLYSWMIDTWVLDVSASGVSIGFNRTMSAVSQIALNYIAVTSTFFLEITTANFDLSTTDLYTLTSPVSRSIARNITYRSKSNSTNSIIAIATIGMLTLRQTVHTFQYSLAISGKYSTSYQVTITVMPYNRIGFVSVCGYSYQSIAYTVSPPYYLSIGYVSDFAGVIPELSGASGITTTGIIFTGMTDWKIDDTNGINTYNLSTSANNYEMISSSLVTCRNAYVWYRQEVCNQYYYLSAHSCIACDITCAQCSGSTSSDCLSCTSTRTYNMAAKTCPCLTGYIDQGARECTQITCNTDLCKTCSYIDQCGSCYAFLQRQLSGTQCVCMKYRYDQYASTGNPFCLSCHYSCYTCTANISTACGTCNTARDNRQFIAANSTCTCLSGYYDSSTAICSKCNYTCSTCQSLSSCLSCNATKSRIFDNTSTFCICSSGLYDDKLQEQCQNCMYACSTCNDGISCVSCPSTRKLANTTTANNQCICNNGYYDNGISKDCLPCQHTCYTCINALTCQSCSSTMHRQFNSSTQKCICNVGYYDDGLNQLCADCHTMCYGCSSSAINACTSCDTASFRVLNTSQYCICMDGYYQVDLFTEMCAMCYYPCMTCINGYECTGCSALMHRIVDATNSSRCVCTSGYYDTGNQLCTRCPYYCTACTNGTVCSACDSATRYAAPNCTCVIGYYDDGVSAACQPCLPQCVTCTNPYNCTSCPPITHTITSQGRCRCASGYLQPSCSICSHPCQQCSTTADNCIQCDGAMYRYYAYNTTTSKGDCLCYDTYYSDNINQLCKPCHYSCATCTNSTSCTSCPLNRQYDTITIYCVCSAQYFQNSTSLNCQLCQYSCSTCSNYSVCTSCNATKHRVVDSIGGSTLCLCETGYYDDGSAQLCYTCAPQCKTCSAYSTCLSCDLPTLHRTLDTSLSRCLCAQSYYQSTVDYLCHACDYSCLTCLDGLSCTVCVSGRVLNVDTGLCRCNDGYYENSVTKLCQICTYPCTKCVNNGITCTGCQGTHLLLISSNTCYCPISTFENTITCQACMSTCYECTNATQCKNCRSSDNRQLTGTAPQLCTCLTGYHDENSTIVACQSCHYSCMTCANSVSCTTCKDIRINSNGTNTYCICPPQRYYDDGTNAVCRTCAYMCLSCEGTSINCTSCSTSAKRYQAINDPLLYTYTCLCETKYYNNPATNSQICLQCHYSCMTCTNSTHCLTCNATLHRVLDSASSTYCVCLPSYYDVTNIETCQPCNYTCKTCTQTATYCTSCDGSRDLVSNACACKSGLFDDMVSSNPVCQACLYLCQTCSSPTSCLTCPSTRSKNASQLCACLSSYYDTLTAKQCLACHPLCKQCTDYQTCTQCYQSTHLRIPFSSSCICQQGYYDDTVATSGSTNYVCQLCHHSCQRCQNANTCSSCNTAMYRVRDVSTGRCKCIDKYYDDGTNQLCVGCLFDCQTCSDGVSCLTCPSQRTLDTTNTPRRCLCSSTYYTNNTVCQSCPPECSACTSYSVCTACNNPSQRTLLLNGTCQCNPKMYPVTNSPSCMPCHYSCASCTSYPFCSTCNSSAQRYLSAKQCKCLQSYYDDLSTQECKACNYMCLTCTNSSQCLTCDTSNTVNRVFNASTKYCSCASGYYQDPVSKLCVQCNYSCYTCNNGSACLSCPSTSLRVLETINYQCLCPSVGYFDKALIPTCVACDPTCYTCTSVSTHCTDCNTPITYRTLTSSNTCVCSVGYYQTTNTVICTDCSYKCLTCASSSTQCTQCSISNNRDNSTVPACSCLMGYYDDGSSPMCQLCDYRCKECLDAYKCTTCDSVNDHRVLDTVSQMCQCDNRYYQPSTAQLNRDAVCIGCHYTCLTCNHATLCLTCDTSSNTRYFNNGQCLCSMGYYDDNTSILCQPCSYKCLTCTSATSCATCAASQNRYYNSSTLYCECLRGYYDVGDGMDPVCLKCDISCYTCTNATHCQTCYPLTNKYVNSTQGTNYCICIYGYYEQVSTGICHACHYSCQRCASLATSCTVCDSSAHRVLSSGSCPCSPTYYDDGRNEMCLQCTTDCVRCFGTNAGQCMQCRNGTYLLNGVCWSVCPVFYYEVDATWSCASCSNYCEQCTDGVVCLQCQSGFYLISATLLPNANSNVNASSMVCVNTCPQFYYHNSTSCLACKSPCLHCTQIYQCLDCIQHYYLQTSLSFCYPCHSTCRYCVDSGALGCISCVDGYYLNSTVNLCEKKVCTNTQYVNSLYGCMQCGSTWMYSMECNAYGIVSCIDGYMLVNVSSGSNSTKQCVRCSSVPGYTLAPSTNKCQQLCGDGIKYSAPCDDGNTLNGDGCSSICTIQSYWQCDTALPSQCILSQHAHPSISVQYLNKVHAYNKIEIVVVLNIGLRLVKGNFILVFGSRQRYQYNVTGLNSKYTRYRLDIQYFQTFAKDKLSIVVRSPIQAQQATGMDISNSSTYGNPYNNRLLQALTTPLTITLQLSLQLQIMSQPPAVYYSPKIRTYYTTIFYIMIIVLHVISLLVCAYFIFYLQLKVMLYTIQLLNFMTVLYIYCTYGLYSVFELSAQAARGLQHYVYRFGQDLEEGSARTSVGYYGFGIFILAGCIIQVVILSICILLKILTKPNKQQSSSSSYTALPSPSSPSASASASSVMSQYHNKFRYYHLSFLYAFIPQLLLCCVIVFKWVQFNRSIQSAYSWGIAIILLVMIVMANVMYIRNAYPYARIIDALNRKSVSINPLPFGRTLSVKDRQRDTDINGYIDGDGVNNNNKYVGIQNKFVSVEQKIQHIQEHNNNMQDISQQYHDNIKNNDPFDPFAQQLQSPNKQLQLQSQTQSKWKQRKNRTRINSSNNQPLWQQQNKTEAVIFDTGRKSQQSRHTNNRKSSASASSNQQQNKSTHSSKSQSTTISQIKQQQQFIALYDLTPTSIPPSVSDISISYHRLLLHQSYLPFKCAFITLIICIVSQIQQPIPRCSILIFCQLITLIYLISTLRIKNMRTIKLFIMCVILLGISTCGLIGSLFVQMANLNYGDTVNSLYVLETVLISLIFIGILWNIGMYMLQVIKSSQFREYKINKKNLEIIQKNQRKNRLRNINQNHNNLSNPLNQQNKRKQSSIMGLKNIFANLRPNDSQNQQYDRNDTKQHLRIDSEINTPNQFNHLNTSSNILIGLTGTHNKKQNLAIIDIQDVQDVDQKNNGNLGIQKKLKNVVSKNVYNSVPGDNNVNKKQKQKQFFLNSLEELQEEGSGNRSNNLQSTRIQESRANAMNKRKQIREKQQSRLDRNNFMSMLENQLMGDNNETAIIVKYQDQKRKQPKDTEKDRQQRDNTLVSYKESEQSNHKIKKKSKSHQATIQAHDKKKEAASGIKKSNSILSNQGSLNENNQKENSKKGSFSIIKDLIPTREHQEDPNILIGLNQESVDQKQHQNQQQPQEQIYQEKGRRKIRKPKDSIPSKNKQDLQSDGQTQSQNEQQGQNNSNQQEEREKDEEQINPYREMIGKISGMKRNSESQKHYKYSIKGNTNKSKSKSKPKPKKNVNPSKKQYEISKLVSIQSELVKVGAEKKQMKMKRALSSNQYELMKTNKIEEGNQQYEFQEQINAGEQAKDIRNYKKQKNKIFELPGELKDDGFEEQEIQIKKSNKSKAKKLQPQDQNEQRAKNIKRKVSPPKKTRAKRIDSISSISEQGNTIIYNKNKKIKFGQSQQQSQASEGVTVFKKIMKDYQIYKDKKVKGNLLKKRQI